MKDAVLDFVMRMTGGNAAVAELCASTVGGEDDGDVCRRVTKDETTVLRTAGDVVSFVGKDVAVDSVATPFVVVGDLLYTRRNWYYERSIGDRVREMSRNVSADEVVLPDTEFYAKLRGEQREAVVAMCKAQFSILTGGPGTGKTHTIARAVRYLQERNPNMRLGLAAPTAKAKDRMDESMRAAGVAAEKSQTIHSLIGINPSTMETRCNRSNPLPFDWLIVDEASMIGLPLMAKLLDALRPECRLTLVGDVDQLASVERGRVFGDLCRMQGVSLSRLDVSARFKPEGDIAKLAAAVNCGDTAGAESVLKAHGPLVSLVDLSSANPYELESWRGFGDLVRRSLASLTACKTPADALAHLNDFRILCAVRKGPFGANSVNDWVKQLLGSRCPIPLMITQNDKTFNVTNGSVGVVMPGDRQNLHLPDRAGPIRMELLPDTELAFASTVHKAQGSEYNDVAVVLPPDGENPLLTREILYTAITRTKGKVFLYGSNKAIDVCCSRKVERVSGLA